MDINESLFWPKVNKTETCWLWTATKYRNGYGAFGVKRRPRGAHRVSWQLANGPIEPGANIDHMCFNKACVNPDHLRSTTPKENQENRQGAQSNSKSGVRGVSWHKVSKKWRAVLNHNGEHVHIGYFRELEDAEKAVIARRNELFTHNNVDRLGKKRP